MHRFAGIRYLSIVIWGVAASHALLPTTAHGQVFVTTWRENTIAEYTPSGTFNPSFISGLNYPSAIAVSGPDIFMGNAGNGTIGEYTTAGATVNPALITGLFTPVGIAISGSRMFVSDLSRGTIGEYTTTGQTINASLVKGLYNPFGVAVFGSDLFVATPYSVGEYTTSGQTVNANFIPLMTNQVQDFTGLAISGSNLFLVNTETNSVSQYSTSGALVHADLITGLQNPYGITVSGSNLFVACDWGPSHVGEYTTSGGAINPYLMSTGSIDYNVAVAGPAGDVNNDGVVNFSDLLIVAQNYGKPGTFGDGDFNGDGIVNFADLLSLAQNYGQTAPLAQPAASVSVPEPAWIAVLAVGITLRRPTRIRS